MSSSPEKGQPPMVLQDVLSSIGEGTSAKVGSAIRPLVPQASHRSEGSAGIEVADWASPRAAARAATWSGSR
eukprot:2741689-Pyramimonas_sp.AAC.1